MDWQGDFLVHAVIGNSLIRTIDNESDVTIEFVSYVPGVNASLREIIDAGPVHQNMPMTMPRCAACTQEVRT